eukprot:NODE_5060_length_704_cov_54.984402_g4897_i0.p1 GENE.NODE_5060_length_704_cov_54.984402_g4897_i0~~NODE_5060_length_704_cov_54.984402_g4897_i0.p1  ORF type:complete len:213 (+),score=60.15 NODE_5060_length_704_cov_54.984402_g4897_i0:63-641(+)
MPSSWSANVFSDDYINARGIPAVEFVSDVAMHLKAKDMNAEGCLKQMQESYSKYKLMDYKLGQNKTSLKSKLPEIKKTLEMVQHLKKQVDADEVIETYFGLSDTVFANAIIKDRPQSVGLWLGANVMVEYTYEEALDLLNNNLAAAQINLDHTLEDLAYLRDQLTVSEVNIARVYNFEVKNKRRLKAEAEAK